MPVCNAVFYLLYSVAKCQKIYKLVTNCSAFGSSYFCANFSRERKSERIDRKFKTQNPILSRSLWLRFSSDKTISYTGFKAVYTYIPNPLGNLPDIGKCEFETGGFQGKAHNLKKMFAYFVI